MESRSATFVRMMLFALSLSTLVVGLGSSALVVAGAAHTAPTTWPFAPTQSLRALLVVQQAQLTAADGAAIDHLGNSVAICGDTAVVGAAFDDVPANTDQGSAYVFTGVMDKPGKPVAKSPKGLIGSRTPTFKWGAAAGAVTYQVRVYKGARLIRKKTGIAKLSWKCTRRLPRGVRLTWKVRAVNEVGAGPWSAKPRFKVR